MSSPNPQSNTPANDPFASLGPEFHSSAQQLIKEQSEMYFTALIGMTRIKAKQRKDQVIQATHVLEAIEALKRREDKSWIRDSIILVSSTVLGASLQGAFVELTKLSERTASSPPPNLLWATIYIILSITSAAVAAFVMRRF